MKWRLDRNGTEPDRRDWAHGPGRPGQVKSTVVRKVTWFDSPEAAEREVDAYYASLTPQERLDEMVRLLNEVGHWNERRLERVVEFIEVPRG